MNIFYLSHNPWTAAQSHCDKHVVKMILEYGQMLSTAHRVLDGVQHEVLHPTTGRKRTFFLMPGEEVTFQEKWIIHNSKMYNATHANHPCNVWVRSSHGNYQFLVDLFFSLLREYTHRYGKLHAAERILSLVLSPPKNLPAGRFTEPPQTMPEEYKAADTITAYQNFYIGSKARFAKWTNCQPPNWFIQRIANYDPAAFTRRREPPTASAP